MPLPDATPDQRIYKLLKTVDLENLTFSDFQKVAQTIYAEQGAEDELRRVVLLNLARMSVAGEWTGLTSAGAAGGFFSGLVQPTTTTSPNEDAINTHMDPLYGQVRGTSPETINFANFDRPHYFPFYSPIAGDVTEMSVRITTADTTGCDMIMGIYDVSNGLPNNLLGFATFDGSSTGVKTQTSFSATISLTAGTLYYFGAVRDQGSSNGKLRCCNMDYIRYVGIGQSIDSTTTSGYQEASGTSLPATATVNEATSDFRPYLSLVVA